MKIYVCEPEKQGYVADIPDTLESEQNVVGGYIEAIYPFKNDLCLICNEEGKILGEPLNRMLFVDMEKQEKLYDVVAGTFFVTRSNDDGENVDITDEDVAYLNSIIGAPQFITVEELRKHTLA